MNRLKNISQFCGCDYTHLYSPLFFYSRYRHSLVVAHMTWHFTHDKKETIVSLLHDVGTPCFAHVIDYVFGDFLNQESSEKKIVIFILFVCQYNALSNYYIVFYFLLILSFLNTGWRK